MATTETSPAATSQGYQLEGSLLEVCNCDTLCPCWIGDDPDNGFCQSVVAYNLTSGKIRGVDVSGLTLIGVVHIPGNILEGNWKQAVLVDDRATRRAGGCAARLLQREAGRSPRRPREPRRRARYRWSGAKIEHSIVDGAGTLKRGGQDRLHDAALPRTRREHHDAQQLDLLDRAGLAGVRGGEPTTRRSTSPRIGQWELEGKNAIQSDWKIDYQGE